MLHIYPHLTRKMPGEPQGCHWMWNKADKERGLGLQWGEPTFLSRHSPEKARKPQPTIQLLILPHNLFSKWLQKKLMTPKAKQLIFPGKWLQEELWFPPLHELSQSFPQNSLLRHYVSVHRSSPSKSCVGQERCKRTHGGRFSFCSVWFPCVVRGARFTSRSVIWGINWVCQRW